MAQIPPEGTIQVIMSCGHALVELGPVDATVAADFMKSQDGQPVVLCMDDSFCSITRALESLDTIQRAIRYDASHRDRFVGMRLVLTCPSCMLFGQTVTGYTNDDEVQTVCDSCGRHTYWDAKKERARRLSSLA